MGNKPNKILNKDNNMPITNNDYSVNSSVISPNNVNSNLDMNTDNHCLTSDIDTNELLSEDGDSLDGLTIPNDTSHKLTDFEEMIDLSRDNVFVKTVDNINEFEKVFRNFNLPNIDEDIINLDEIAEFFSEFEKDDSSTNVASIDTHNFEYGNSIETAVTDKQHNNENTLKQTITGNCLESTNENYNNISIDNITCEESSHFTLTSSFQNNEPTGSIVNKIWESDIISVSSDDTKTDDGYNSSDFEFITETEANMDDLIINSSSDHFNDENNNKNVNNLAISENRNIIDPGEGPSGINAARTIDNTTDYRQNHVVPEGDDYLNLFQGHYYPMALADVIILENKSVRPSPMNIRYDGIGFDKQLIARRHQPDSSDDEYADEAKDNIKKILSMYPGENRKRRRR